MATIGIEYVREYRPCMVVDKRALFHGWEEKTLPVPDEPESGFAPGAQIKLVMAIVEYEDGTIDEVPPAGIRFTDGKTRRFCFGDNAQGIDGIPVPDRKEDR